LSPSTQADFLKNGEVIFTGDVTAGFVVSGTMIILLAVSLLHTCS